MYIYIIPDSINQSPAAPRGWSQATMKLLLETRSKNSMDHADFPQLVTSQVGRPTGP